MLVEKKYVIRAKKVYLLKIAIPPNFRNLLHKNSSKYRIIGTVHQKKKKEKLWVVKPHLEVYVPQGEITLLFILSTTFDLTIGYE